LAELNKTAFFMLNDYVNEYLNKAMYQSEIEKISFKIYNLCTYYIFDIITPEETEILKQFFKIK
jgi:hypothetical protein